MQTKVIEPVRFSDWATPIVPVLKADGKLSLPRLQSEGEPSLPFRAISNS